MKRLAGYVPFAWMIRFGWILFIIFFISGCSMWPGKPTTASTTMEYTTAGVVVTVKLYFPNADNSALPYENREVSVKEGAILKAAIEALLVGPVREDLRKSIPEGTRLLGINLKDQIATVDFSKEFTATAGLGEILARASLVNTLTEVAGVERVRIWVEGNELIGPSGMPLGEMTRFALDEKGYPLPGTKVMLSLYYGLGDATYMQEEKREAVLQNGASLERLALEELIKGPENKDLYPVVPLGTQVLSVITQSGTCTVNFSRDFIDNANVGTAGESMIINGIVNTLTSLPDIQQVRFLVEGTVRPAYIHAVFDEPFVRNEGIITHKTD